MTEDPVTLFSLAGGGAAELFDEELAKVIENILDINTDIGTVREVRLTVKLKPDESRKSAVVSVQVTSKTGAFKGLGSMFFFGKRGGRCFAVENNPNQGQLFDRTARPTAVNFETGEVKE